MKIKFNTIYRIVLLAMLFSALEPTGFIGTIVHTLCGAVRMGGFYLSIALIFYLFFSGKTKRMTEVLLFSFVIMFALSTLFYSKTINDTCAYFVRNTIVVIVSLKFLYMIDPYKACRDVGIMLTVFLIFDAMTFFLPGLGVSGSDSNIITCFLGTKTTITYYMMPTLMFDYVYLKICRQHEKKLALIILVTAVLATVAYLVQIMISTALISLALSIILMVLTERNSVIVTKLAKLGPPIASAVSALIVAGSSLPIFTYFITEVLHESADLDGRGPLWEMALSYIRVNPIFGYGLSTGVYLSSWQEKNESAHNLFLGIILHAGVVGFLVFAGIIVYLCVVNIKTRGINHMMCCFLVGMLTIILVEGIAEDFINNTVTFCAFSIMGNARLFIPAEERIKQLANVKEKRTRVLPARCQE